MFFKTKMLKARSFERNGGHRFQQTDRIVNNFLRWFITEPRTYIKERGAKTIGAILDKKDR